MPQWSAIGVAMGLEYFNVVIELLLKERGGPMGSTKLSTWPIFAMLHLLLAGSLVAAPAIGQSLVGNDAPPEVLAAFNGIETLRTYVRAGGKFTGQKNAGGQTAAMFVAGSGPEAIDLFVKAGGTFTEQADQSGFTAAMYAVQSTRPGTIEAFVQAGGRFTNKSNEYGQSAATVVLQTPQNIPAFVKNGGRFGVHNKGGQVEGIIAVLFGVEAIQAFSAAGGKFTSEQENYESAESKATNLGPEVLEAYRQAVEKQGGLVYLSDDDEFSSLKNPLAIESFVKAGGHFDFRTDQNGWTIGMKAVYAGPEILRAFAKYGGKFTTQQNQIGDTAGSIAEEYDTIRGVGLLAAYNEAVKQQGGLITLMPSDEYEAARIGAAAVAAYAKAGGHFTDLPDQDDLTSAMIAASSGADVIDAFYRAGGRFSNWQNKDGYTAAIVAVIAGAEAIRAFARAQGKFTDQQDHHGMTAAMWAVSRTDYPGWPTTRMELKFPQHLLGSLVNPGSPAIEAFAASGGRFTEQQDISGQTAAMMVINNSPEAIGAFAAAGGKFSEQEDENGSTAEVWAAFRGADRVRAFAAAGGHLTDHQSANGTSSERTAALADDAEVITAYSEAGGIFTDRKGQDGWTSEMLASNLSEWFAQTTAKLTQRPIDAPTREEWKKRFGERDLAAAKAYKDAVARQGGLRHVH